MKAERTYDQELIEGFLREPSIYARIKEDGCNEVKLDPDSEAWLLMTDKTTAVGVYCLHPLNSTTLQIHAHVIDVYRQDHAYETGLEALRWFLNNTEHLKLVAEIPTLYPDVIKFTKKYGFQHEGLNRQSIMKQGKLYDQVWLGITRPEVEELF